MSPWLELCRAAVRDVEAVLVEMPTREERERPIGQGKGGDITAALDEAAENVILKHFDLPDVRIVSEEIGIKGEGALTVCVDPIDGSQNAERAIPYFALCVAVAEGTTMDDVVFGFVHDFGSGEEWTAVRGGGAFLNGVPLTGRPKDEIEFMSIEATRAELVYTELAKLAPLTDRIRIMGAQAITFCHLAAGRTDAVVVLKPSRSVDFAASQLLVRERGFAIHAVDGPELGTIPLDLEARSRICAAGTEELRAAYRRSATLLGMEPSKDAVLAALANVIDPELRKPVTDLDMVREIAIDGGDVTVTIALTVAGCPLRNSFQEQVAREVGSVEGVASVRLEFDVMSPDERAALTSKLRGGRPESDKTIQLDPTTRVIAVASGKGGVGKSTLTANLAAAFAAQGRRVGILDADIYGHSIPQMLGIHQKPVLVDKLMIPPVAHDMKLMSIGFFVDDNKPLMWRGPMLHRALEQFLQDVHWGELDILVVDMPPGTGDVAISLGQMLPRAEAVVVTTPQLLAQEVASRAAEMARRTGMQLVGVIENMTSEIFGSGGGERLAAQLGVKLLGSVPLDIELRESADEGVPLVISDPDSDAAQAVIELARAIDLSRGAGFTRTLPLVS